MNDAGAYICADRGCRGRVAPVVAEDIPGEHTYVFACRKCHREYGGDWVIRNWGESESAPRIDLEPWGAGFAITMAALTRRAFPEMPLTI